MIRKKLSATDTVCTVLTYKCSINDIEHSLRINIANYIININTIYIYIYQWVGWVVTDDYKGI